MKKLRYGVCLLLFLLCLSVLTACRGEDVLSAGTQKEVETAWYEHKGTILKWYDETNDTTWKYGIRYYGTCGDSVILFQRKKGDAVEIGGISIEPGCIVYRDNAFYSVTEAFENAWLSEKDLQKIAEEHERFSSAVGKPDVYILEGCDLIAPLPGELRDEMEAKYGSLDWTEELNFVRYYGNYNGAVAVYSIGQVGYSEYRVAGVLFDDVNSININVYKEGKTVSLKEAYNLGWVTEKDVQTMGQYHELYNYTKTVKQLSEFFGKTEVEEAWKEEKGYELGWYRDGGEVRYYGKGNTILALFEPGEGTEKTELTIAGQKIAWDGEFEIYVYHEGKFYSLEDAYAQGIADERSVKTIAALHDQYEKMEAEFRERDE